MGPLKVCSVESEYFLLLNFFTKKLTLFCFVSLFRYTVQQLKVPRLAYQVRVMVFEFTSRLLRLSEMCKKTQTLLCLVFSSKRMATGARQCLSTGHRKQQDFPLWTLPLWTLVAQIKSSASISGQCASCKVFGGDVSGRTVRLLN